MAQLTQETAVINVNKRCSEMGYSFRDFTYSGVKHTRIYLECSKHSTPYGWDCSYNKFVYERTGCPKCSHEQARLLRTNSYDKVITQITNRCNEMNYTFNSEFKYVDRNSKIEFHCFNQEHKSWKASYNNFVHDKTNCPTCAKVGYQIDIGGYFYINRIYHNDILYYKIGISNNYTTRLKRLNENQGSETTCYRLYYSDDGEMIRDFEHHLKHKTNISFGVLSKEQYQDGFTETFSETDLEKILDLCDSISQYRIH